MDALVNFGVSAVATAPSPATSGTSLTVTTGQGSRFPTGSFDCTFYAPGTTPDASNAEICRVTISTDTMTLTRAQYGTTAKSIAIGWIVDNAVTANLLGQLMATSTYDPAAIAQQVVGTTATQTLTNKTLTAPSVDELTVTGITGSVSASRYVGATASGAPTTGAHLLGDWVTTQDGNIYICTVAGSPGTWVKVGGSAALTSDAQVAGGLTSLGHTNVLTTVFTTASLGVGTWLLTAAINISFGSPCTAGAAASAGLVTGTATASMVGGTGGYTCPGVISSAFEVSLPITSIITVTGAGTMLIKAQYLDTTNNGAVQPSGTAYTAVKIA